MSNQAPISNQQPPQPHDGRHGVTQPGWYPDVHGTMRWWDGSAWTEHTQPSETPTRKPWYKKKLWWAVAAVVLVIAVAAGTGGNDRAEDSAPAASQAKEPAPADEPAAEEEPPADEPAAEEEPPADEPAAEEEPAAEPEYTVSQEQAIQAAESYLEFSGFSRQGLIDQLTSEYGEGFPMKDAVFAVNHVEVDWNAEAVESAKSYLEMGGFSRQGLIDQLTSEYGEQFTMKQAVYAVNQVGL